ncbi:MAG TPA: sulfatase [Cyclobacteriaceae bacterium]|nr:sulfatase [Cyclobacteriaceae bacterium]
MKKIYAALIMFAFFVQTGCSSNENSARENPNVIIIFMDDMGYGDLECYGATPYHTPNINKLASQGMRFTHFYAAQAVCSASRAALMTGCYPNRLGISGAFMPWSKVALNPDEETIAELLHASGYKTGMVGKWHLGQKEPFLPLQQGFDEYLGLPYSNDMWPVDYDGYTVVTDTNSIKHRFPTLPLIDGNKTVREIKNLDDQAELTTLYTERAKQFINSNKENPFFLYMAHSMPHVPIAASSKFKGKSKGGLYGDVIEELDWSVGEIMMTLDELKLSDNTLVILTSDNGPWLLFGNHAGNTGGLREGKGTHWEGGTRVPCIMRWPGVIPAGAVSNSMAVNFDILPTLVAACKAKLPTHKIDGINILPIITQSQEGLRDEFAYYYDVNNLKAVRKGSWKLVFPCQYQTAKKQPQGKDGWPGKYSTDSTGLALFNMQIDPGESLDLKSQYPEMVDSLRRIADRYRKELGDNLTGIQGEGVRTSATVN